MLLAILVVLCFAVALMLWKPWSPVQTKTEVTSEQPQEDTNKDYRFYELLPQQQVTPIPEQAVPGNKSTGAVVIIEAPEVAASEASPNQTGLITTEEVKNNYILQVRSYNDPDQADARRAEIILNGLSADVLKIQENGETWYRVISGPYESQDAAVSAQQTLQHSGIDSIVVKR